MGWDGNLMYFNGGIHKLSYQHSPSHLIPASVSSNNYLLPNPTQHVCECAINVDGWVCVCVCVCVKGDLKKITVDNLDTYVHKDPQLPIVLDRFVVQQSCAVAWESWRSGSYKSLPSESDSEWKNEWGPVIGWHQCVALFIGLTLLVIWNGLPTPKLISVYIRNINSSW